MNSIKSTFNSFFSSVSNETFKDSLNNDKKAEDQKESKQPVASPISTGSQTDYTSDANEQKVDTKSPDDKQRDPIDEEEVEGLVETLAHAFQLRHPKAVLQETSLESICQLISEGKAKNIIVMSGAGISTAAGIPDFRSPNSGLYSNLERFNLPYAEAIFDLEFFVDEPEPFFMLAKELYPGQFIPTVTHHFIKLLSDKGLLLRNYTQNIDTLERVVGIQDDKLVEAHGSFFTAHCINRLCRKQYSHEQIKEKVFKDEIPYCDKCDNLVKPDIVFFGEGLPDKFFQMVPNDFLQCDLLIVMGTSLTVHPFASLITKVKSHVPRLLINLHKAGTEMAMGFDFNNRHGLSRDVVYLGKCDDGCMKMAEILGWKDDLAKCIESFKQN